jgi:hypothetical protein
MYYRFKTKKAMMTGLTLVVMKTSQKGKRQNILLEHIKDCRKPTNIAVKKKIVMQNEDLDETKQKTIITI